MCVSVCTVGMHCVSSALVDSSLSLVALSGSSCVIVGTCGASGETLGGCTVATLGVKVIGSSIATLRSVMTLSVGLSSRESLKITASCWIISVYIFLRGLNGDAGCVFLNDVINSSTVVMARLLTTQKVLCFLMKRNRVCH